MDSLSGADERVSGQGRKQRSFSTRGLKCRYRLTKHGARGCPPNLPYLFYHDSLAPSWSQSVSCICACRINQTFALHTYYTTQHILRGVRYESFNCSRSIFYCCVRGGRLPPPPQFTQSRGSVFKSLFLNMLSESLELCCNSNLFI